MNAGQILKKIIQQVTPKMHQYRRKALIACVDSLMNGHALTVTQLGRGINGSAKEKHRIKRADRLLSNPHFRQSHLSIYASAAALFVSRLPRPLISIDWSDMDGSRKHFLLRAALSFQGRSVTLYEEVHTSDKKEKPKTHQVFLNNLAIVLPNTCRPVIITDAGFRVPWFKQVEAPGWDFVGRVRNRHHCQSSPDSPWIHCKTLYTRATSKARHLGSWLLTERHTCPVQPVIYKQSPRGRHKKTRQGERARSATSKRSAEGAREPWLLATSLPGNSVKAAKGVVSCYGTRMQIEEGFRDMKSVRGGLSGNLHLAREASRLQALVLLGTLAHWVSLACGLAADMAKISRHYQVNTVVKRRVLSLFFLGLRVYQDTRVKLSGITWSSLLKHWNELILKEEISVGLPSSQG